MGTEAPGGWFAIRGDLGGARSRLLAFASFLLPLAAWCFVSYTPWVWHPDIRLDLSADRAGVTTFYAAGDHVDRGYFPSFAGAVREANAAIGSAADAPPDGGGATRRANQKKLRHLAPLLIENRMLLPGQREDDAAIYRAWGQVARGELAPSRPALSGENLEIVRKNWAALSARSPEFSPDALPPTPLLALVPQGRPANPVYLPAPDRVLDAGIRDWITPPENGGPTMGARMVHSARIVFGGFLLSCLVGVPLGILCGVYPLFSKLFEPFIDFFRYLPAPSFATLLVAIFLAHDAPKIALVFIGTFFQMVLVVAKTTRMLDPGLVEAAQTLGAKPRQLLGKVVVPGILPDLYNDLRILLGWSWTWLVIAELIGVKSGLTEFIETQGRFRNFDRVFPVIIAIGLLGFFTDQILAFFRQVLFPWSGPPPRGLAGLVVRRLRAAGDFCASAIAERVEAISRAAIDRAGREGT